MTSSNALGETQRIWVALGTRPEKLGEKLGDLGTIEGRVDLRGVVAPEPTVAREHVVFSNIVEERSGFIRLKGVHWKNLDFSRARLPSLRFFDSTIENCRFDFAFCHDWRMWGTRVDNTSFAGADLRQASLGGARRR